MGTRIAPAQPPYAAKIQECFDRLLPKGVAPLVLFTTLARDQRLLERFINGAPLDVDHLTLRQREIVIDRVTALCGSEYEWGVHIAFFARRAGLSDEQIASTAKAGSADPVWSEQERLLLSACDQLHANGDLDEASWRDLQVAARSVWDTLSGVPEFEPLKSERASGNEKRGRLDRLNPNCGDSP